LDVYKHEILGKTTTLGPLNCTPRYL